MTFRSKFRSVLGAVLLLCSTAFAFGQTTTTLTGVVENSQGSPLANGQVIFELTNCAGAPTAGTTEYSFTLDSSGNISGTVEPNSLNGCPGSSSYYTVTASQSGFLVWQRSLLAPAGSWAPGSAIPLSSIPASLGGSGTAVEPDWNATSGLAAILNKPTIPAAQVNSDWTSTSGPSQILNKPAAPPTTANVLGSSAGALTPATSAQIVAALNVSPSEVLSTSLLPALPYVSSNITVNGHSLSANVVLTPADLAAGALANGMTATTQTAGDSTNKVATDSFVAAAVAGVSGGGASIPATPNVLKGGGSANSVVAAIPGTDYVVPSGNITGRAGGLSGNPAVSVSSATVSGAVAACTVNGITNPTACGFSGDIGVQVNAAAAALCPTNPVVFIPASFSAGEIRIPAGSYTYTTDIYLPCPMTLSGEGAQLTYNGTGKAIKVGPDGLSQFVLHNGIYRVTGLTLSGGASMVQGVYFNDFLVNVETDHLRFNNFGSTTSWAMYYAGNNWEVKSDFDTFWITDTTGRNFAQVTGSNSRVTFDHLLAHGGIGQGNSTTNIGLDLNNSLAIVENSEISVFGINVLLDQFGDNIIIKNNLMECWNNNGCIGYGGLTASNLITGTQIVGNDFNVHGIDGGLTGSVLFPRGTASGLSYTLFEGNSISNLPAVPAIVQNNNAAQSGNVASANNSSGAVIPTLHTAGSNISAWVGTDGDGASSSAQTVAETTGNLGEFDFDSGSPTAGLTLTGSPTVSTSTVFSAPNAVLFNAASEYYSGTLSSSASTVYFRAMINLQTIVSGQTTQIVSLNNSSGGQIFNLYLASGSGFISAFDVPLGGSGTTCETAALTGWHRIEFAWVQGASTGSYSVSIDGTQTCSVTNVNTGTVQVAKFEFGELGTPASPFVFNLDNVGFSSTAPLGAVTVSGGGGAQTTIASSETVAYSATPTFSTSYRSSYIVLTGSVSSFTIASGSDGQEKTLIFCQNGTGGFTVAAPTNVHGFFTVGTTLNKCSAQHFTYSAGKTAWFADSAGATNE